METITKTTESGAFIRTVIRHGKQRIQTTKRIKPNMKKVVLGYVGEFEVYVYPFDYPDKVFMGKFPVSTMLDSTNVKQILGVYNQMRWFLSGQAFNEPLKSKAANARRRAIVSAYNLALNEKRSNDKTRFSPNYNYTNNGEKKQI
jgi:hypothetical protein